MLSALRFLRTLLASFCFMLYVASLFPLNSQTRDERGALTDFFNFSDPYGGHYGILTAFKLRNHYFFKYYLFFEKDNQQLDD